MGNKSDFSQAFKEVFSSFSSKDEAAKKEVPMNKTNERLDRYTDEVRKSQPTTPPPSAVHREDRFESEIRPSAKAAQSASKHTVISESTIVRGDIETKDSLDLYGEVHGNVTTQGNLNVKGKVLGNVQGFKIITNNAVIAGDVESKSEIYVGEGSRIVGDVISNSAEVSGKIKGNINSKDSVTLGKGSVVIGDISSEVIEVNKGAYVKGRLLMIGMDDTLVSDMPHISDPVPPRAPAPVVQPTAPKPEPPAPPKEEPAPEHIPMPKPAVTPPPTAVAVAAQTPVQAAPAPKPVQSSTSDSQGDSSQKSLKDILNSKLNADS